MTWADLGALFAGIAATLAAITGLIATVRLDRRVKTVKTVVTDIADTLPIPISDEQAPRQRRHIIDLDASEHP